MNSMMTSLNGSGTKDPSTRSVTGSTTAVGMGRGLALAAALLPSLALAEDAAVPDKGDTAWMMVSTLLVILMTVPGLALFYGGLVRTKNMLSVLTQVFSIFSFTFK